MNFSFSINLPFLYLFILIFKIIFYNYLKINTKFSIY